MIEILYSIELKSSLSIGTGIGTSILDSTIVRQSNGKAYIPGSTIKGKLRATMEPIARAFGYPIPHGPANPEGCLLTQPTACLLCRIFGAAQRPGEVMFENAVLPADVLSFLEKLDTDRTQRNFQPRRAYSFGRQIRTNVSLDRRTRTALPNHLFTRELVSSPASFEGKIRGQFPSEKAALEREVALLAGSLNSISYLGGGRSRGSGACLITIVSVKINGAVMDWEKKILETAGGEP